MAVFNASVVATMTLLLLQLTVCCNVTQSQSPCEDETCHISPDNFGQLQDMISSNRHIELNGTEFSVNGSNECILIVNVSNLTISGGESGSLIECSPQSTFGFYLTNATNVTFTSITITHCSCPYVSNVTFSIETSSEIILSAVHIEYSPEYALQVFDYETNDSSEDPFFFMDNENPSVAVIDCTISHSRVGSVYIFGQASVLIERTVIANSTDCIFSIFADIMMKDVDAINCTKSYLLFGRAMVRGRLTMNNISFSLFSQDLHVHGSKISSYNGAILALYSHIFVAENSEVLSAGLKLGNSSNPNLPALIVLLKSSLQLSNSSTLIFTENIEVEAILALIESEMFIIGGSALLGTHNSVTGEAAFVFEQSTVFMSGGKLVLHDNKGPLVHANRTTILIENISSIELTQNRIYRNFSSDKVGAGAWASVTGGLLNISSDSMLTVTGNDGLGDHDILSLTFYFTNVSLEGTVIVANNTINNNGILNIVGSKVWFNGRVEVVGNRGETGAITAGLDSHIFITDTASFVDNVAEYGGALTLLSSVMYLSTGAKIDFTGNQAKEFGGAIYVNPITAYYTCGSEVKKKVDGCSIQALPDKSSDSCQPFTVTFNQNKAGKAGNAIYGDKTSACVPTSRDYFCDRCLFSNTSEIYQYSGVNDSSDLSNFTSNPTRVCFCENGIPDCYKVVRNITVHPGERFYLSLATVGYGFGTVPGSVVVRDNGNAFEGQLLGNTWEYVQEIKRSECQDVEYSIVSEKDRQEIALTVDTLSLTRSQEYVNSVVAYKLTRDDQIISDSFTSGLEEFFHIAVFVKVDLLPCPVGFQLVRGKCVCHQILQKHKIDTCFFSNGTSFILRPAPYWVGLPSDPDSPILIHPHCPFDYCQSEDINITAESQCQHQRSGVLCGSCREGLSMILGSSECKTCSNVYLVSITVFILMGVALVTLVTLLNITVSVGTLNGLVLFANILQANRNTFLAPTTSDTSAVIAFLDVFIAWLNLDLGIPMCFLDGLTTYVKTWLQFVFPLYILALVGAIIIASKYSARVTRILGTNAVSVLATLVLLSYTKILRILITAFSFTTLSGSQSYHSNVWLADGNIEYFELKHAILFLVALLVLLLLGLPYTVTLTAAPWIQRSRFKWLSSLYNRFKPLFDAYMGPYKDSHRYWAGMLLLARVFLIVLFSSIANNTSSATGPQLILLLLILSSSTLIGLTAVLKPYKTRLLNGLELFHLAILLIFASSNLYVLSIGTGDEPRAYIYIFLVVICFLVFLGICAGHVWYRVRKAMTRGRRPEPLRDREEEDRFPQWRMAKIGAEYGDENREDVALTTLGATNTISDEDEEEGFEYRESALELASFN